MNIIDVMKNKLGLSRKQFYIFLGVSVLWFIWCCLHLVLPNLGSTIGMIGIVMYLLFFFLFFYSDFFSQILVKKKIIASIIVAISALCTFVILYQANWIFGDDHEYITRTVVNKYVTFSGYISFGRFFPLGHIHYNYPLFLFRSLGINTGLPVEWHFAFLPVFFIVSYVCLYLLFNKIEPSHRKNNKYPVFSLFFASTFFLLGASFPLIFLKLVFPETQGIMLFSIFMLMYYKALETDKIKYYFVALLVAVYNTYCKEPVFGVFLIVALTNHLFRYKKESKREKIFYMTLIANGVVFIILYYFLVYRKVDVFYNELYGSGTVGIFQFVISIFIKNPMLIIMFLFGFIRVYYITVKNKREHLYYDSLLFAGMAYVIAYIMLGMNWDYYFMPSIILFLPSFVYWTKYMYEKKRMYALCLFFVLLPIYTSNSLSAIATTRNIWQERQEFVPSITNLLSEYNSGKEFIWYRYHATPTDTDWEMQIANIFLNYFNKSEEIVFFTEKRYPESVELKENTLLFFPAKNNHMPDELIKTLQDNDFEIYPNGDVHWWTFIYRQKE